MVVVGVVDGGGSPGGGSIVVGENEVGGPCGAGVAVVLFWLYCGRVVDGEVVVGEVGVVESG